MRYITTRNNDTAYDVLHVLTQSRAEDGGFYIPAEMPVFSLEEIEALATKNPNQIVADILNLLFDCELTRWDVDFAAGRYPVRLAGMVRRIAIAEGWHNVDWEFERTVRDLAGLVRGTQKTEPDASDWFSISVRIGFLFASFGELMRDGIAGTDRKVDVVMPSGNFRDVMACWYARSWGLPVDHIIICCNENNNLWNLIRQGEMRMNITVKPTVTPECDRVFPEDLERLLCACGGPAEAIRFAECVEEGRGCYPEPLTLQRLQDGLYVSVVSQSRVETTIPTIYKNHGYVFGPYSALCYAGLTDYRSRTGSGNYALLLSHRGALRDDGFVAGCLNMAVQTLHNIL